MAVKSSGQIGLNTDVVTEFGTDGVNGIGLTDYYRGGGLVPNTATNSGIAASGQISLTSFYSSKAVTYFAIKYDLDDSTGVYELQYRSVAASNTTLMLFGNDQYSNGNVFSNTFSAAITTDDGVTSGGHISGSTTTTLYNDYINDSCWHEADFGTLAVGAGQWSNSTYSYPSVLYNFANGTPSAYQYMLAHYGQFKSVVSYDGGSANGTLYLGGYSNSGLSSIYGYVSQTAANGVVMWQRALSGNTSGSAGVLSLGLDSTGNVYLNNGTPIRGTAKPMISKYNSSGTRLWSTYTNGSSNWLVGYNYLVNGSPKIVFDGRGYGWTTFFNISQVPGTYNYPPAEFVDVIASFNSNGTFEHTFETANTIYGFGVSALGVSGNTLYVAINNILTSVNVSTKAIMSSISIWKTKKLSGTISTSTTSNVVTGTGTLFLNELVVRSGLVDSLYTANNQSIGAVSTKSTQTSLTLSANASVALSSQPYYLYEGVAKIKDINVVDGELILSGETDYGTLGGTDPSGLFVLKIPANLSDAVTTFESGNRRFSINAYSYSFGANSAASTTTTFTPSLSTPAYGYYNTTAINTTHTYSNTTTTIL